MAMNREQKRLLRRQGEIGEDGAPAAGRRQQPNARPPEDRTSPVEFVREVRSELRKVAWPTRSETINYSIIVLVTIVVLTTFIAGLDWFFSKFVLELFGI
jgi:preprotein translocase subunit SecE